MLLKTFVHSVSVSLVPTRHAIGYFLLQAAFALIQLALVHRQLRVEVYIIMKQNVRYKS